jgi:hypothetical protein
MMDKETAEEVLDSALGSKSRVTQKICEWQIGQIGIVLQTDQPNRDAAAYIWLPYPDDGEAVPEFALEYPGEAGRHSNTYAAPGLERGKPVLKLIVRSERELGGAIEYARAMSAKSRLPTVNADQRPFSPPPTLVDGRAMPPVEVPKPRREAIPRAVQREVWQRDGGRCVECSTRELLCFDHIVPFSRGGSNTVRNIQLLCERCNLSKGNRL